MPQPCQNPEVCTFAQRGIPTKATLQMCTLTDGLAHNAVNLSKSGQCRNVTYSWLAYQDINNYYFSQVVY